MKKLKITILLLIIVLITSVYFNFGYNEEPFEEQETTKSNPVYSVQYLTL